MNERASDTRGSSFDFRFLLGLHSTNRHATQVTNASAFPENERGDSLSMQHNVGDDFEGDEHLQEREALSERQAGSPQALRHDALGARKEKSAP